MLISSIDLHPLENTIEFYLTFNPNNKISNSGNQQKINALIQIFQEACENLIIIYSNIQKEAILNLWFGYIIYNKNQSLTI